MKPNNATSASESLKALASIFERGANVGFEFLESLAGSAPKAFDGLIDWASARPGAAASCCCEIPPPCWMPKPLGEVASFGRAGNLASVTFAIENCSMAVRKISVHTTSVVTGLTFSANELTLGPMERGEIEVTYSIPSTLTEEPGTEILLWVRGCKLHFLRWTIELSPLGGDTSYELNVKDCPDLVHHWYDHFYCPRPCLPDQREPHQ